MFIILIINIIKMSTILNLENLKQLKKGFMSLVILTFIVLCTYKPSYSESISFEYNLALKYCDSLEKKLFEGLDNEKTLKYSYFFDSLNEKELKNKFKNLNLFEAEVEKKCEYKLTKQELEDFNKFLNIYYKNKKQ